MIKPSLNVKLHDANFLDRLVSITPNFIHEFTKEITLNTVKYRALGKDCIILELEA